VAQPGREGPPPDQREGGQRQRGAQGQIPGPPEPSGTQQVQHLAAQREDSIVVRGEREERGDGPQHPPRCRAALSAQGAHQGVESHSEQQREQRIHAGIAAVEQVGGRERQQRRGDETHAPPEQLGAERPDDGHGERAQQRR
jgi:hypothetical protein